MHKCGNRTMTPEQFRQVEALFHRGKDLPPEEQRALLDAEPPPLSHINYGFRL